ncbi:MAG: hypothetical protein O7H41_11935 [Planctomycetota bacterium]|nr:hypothetical protein [Planctomycetota bacterium]
MMTDEVRNEIDQLREEIRQIGATLKGFRQDLDEIDRIKTGPQGEIDLEAWNRAEGVRDKIRDCVSRRDHVQGRLNELLRPFRAKKVIPALRERGMSVKELIGNVKKAIPEEGPAGRHLRPVLEEALGIDDEGQALGRLLDQFLWWEVRSEVQRLLGIEVQNGNGR